MTEPGTGSDLQAIATTARLDGDQYVLDGSKTFITNGQQADLIIVAAKTDPSQKAQGVSLLVVETASAEGFRRGQNLAKIGMHGQDTSELFFAGVRVPRDNLLRAREGLGFVQLMEQLPQERLIVAVSAVAGTEAALARVFVERCTELLLEKKRDAQTGAMAKYWTTEKQFEITDLCLQLHGCYGYMDEYPISRAWRDARVQRIYGGTNEIMKELISRFL